MRFRYNLGFLLFLALAAYGQERVAIIQTLDDRDSIGISELAYLTDRLRETAVNALPKLRYGVMTTESIVAFLGSQERAAKECREANCLAELGRKVNADYVAQARVGRFGENLTIKTELYSSKSGNLLGSFTGNSGTLQGLRSIIDEKAPALFNKMQREAAEINAKAKSEEKIEPEKRIRFGARANVGTAGLLTQFDVSYYGRGYYFNQISSEQETADVGDSYGLGAFVAIPLFGINIVPEIYIQHREPIHDFHGLTVEENLIEIPLLFRFRYREENIVYLGFGPFLGIALNVQDNQDGAFKDYRAKLEGGLLLELGFRIGDHFSIDIREGFGFAPSARKYFEERYVSDDGSYHTYGDSNEQSDDLSISFGSSDTQEKPTLIFIIQLGVSYVF
jgi:hypothetical protein